MNESRLVLRPFLLNVYAPCFYQKRSLTMNSVDKFGPYLLYDSECHCIVIPETSLEKHGLLFKCICWLTAAILNCELWHLQILRVLRSNIDGNWRAGTDSDEYKSLSMFNVSSICSNSHPVYKNFQFLYSKHDGFLQWHDDIDLGLRQRAERCRVYFREWSS